VDVTDVTATPPGMVVAMLTYHYKDGHTVVKRTSFGLVQQDGQWKLASSTLGRPGLATTVAAVETTLGLMLTAVHPGHVVGFYQAHQGIRAADVDRSYRHPRTTPPPRA
jgi:hypothetical protein